jgi:multiple sugar transport system substrate-binding protein
MLMQKMFKTVCIMLLIISVVLAGCSSSQETSQNSDSGSKANNENKSSKAGKVEVTFWSGFSGPDGPFMKKIVDKYNSSQDKYKVNFVIQPFAEYYKQIDIALSTDKNRPNVMIMHVDQVPTYVDKGQLQPLDDMAKSAGIKKDDYVSAPVEYATIDGKWYAIPLDVHPLLFYYNKDLFAKAGINKVPTNREEFVEAAKKLTDASQGQYGFVVPTLWPQQFIFPTIMLQNGGSWLDGSGKIAYNSPEGVEALEFMRSLIDMKLSPENVQQDGEVTLFLQGKNAMHLNGPWMKGQFDESGLNYGVAPVPRLGTKQDAVFGGSHTFVVPSAGKDEKILAGIGDFLKYVAGHSMDWVESGQAVASKNILQSDEFNKLEHQSSAAKQFDYANFAPRVLNWGTISEPLWGEVNLALLGKKEAKKALDDAAKKSTQVMND